MTIEKIDMNPLPASFQLDNTKKAGSKNQGGEVLSAEKAIRSNQQDSACDATDKIQENPIQNICEVDSEMEQIKAQLEEFLKTYPPYPPDNSEGNEERISYLQNFNAFRKLIEQFTNSVEHENKLDVLEGPEASLMAQKEA